MSKLTRILGVSTAAFGAAIIVKPSLLAKPCRLTDARGRVPTATRVLIASLGARDLVSGLAMVFAPEGKALDTAVALRVASDVGDAVLFGRSLPDKAARLKAVEIAGGWGARCALSALIGR